MKSWGQSPASYKMVGIGRRNKVVFSYMVKLRPVWVTGEPTQSRFALREDEERGR